MIITRSILALWARFSISLSVAGMPYQSQFRIKGTQFYRASSMVRWQPSGMCDECTTLERFATKSAPGLDRSNG